MITELCEAENLQQRARELALKITASAPLGVQAALKSSKLARMQGDKAALSEVFVDMRTVIDRKSTRLNSSHVRISYAVFCLKKKKNIKYIYTTHSPNNS